MQVDKGKALCVGGFLDGELVDFIGGEYIPFSENDVRDFYAMPAAKIVNSKIPAWKYCLHRVEFGKDNHLNFYIWNDDEKLKDNLMQRYLERKIK